MGFEPAIEYIDWLIDWLTDCSRQADADRVVDNGTVLFEVCRQLWTHSHTTCWQAVWKWGQCRRRLPVTTQWHSADDATDDSVCRYTDDTHWAGTVSNWGAFGQKLASLATHIGYGRLALLNWTSRLDIADHHLNEYQLGTEQSIVVFTAAFYSNIFISNWKGHKNCWKSKSRPRFMTSQREASDEIVARELGWREPRGLRGVPAGMEANVAGFPREWKQMLREFRGNGNIILRDSRGNVCSFYPIMSCCDQPLVSYWSR